MITRKKIISILLVLFTLFLISQVIFINKYVPLYGENQYSFSYSGHIKWIIQDWTDNPSLLFKSHKCEECQFFGMYSRWVMLWIYLILVPGEMLRINPFIWYLFVSFVFQFIGIKYFIESAFKNNSFNNKFILFLSIFFSTIPYKWIQITTQWEYPFVYFTFIILIGTYLRLMYQKKLTISQLNISQVAAVFIFNLSINHLPILIYSILILSLIIAIKYRFKCMYLIKNSFFILAPSMLINIPMIISIIINEDIATYQHFISNSWISILSLGYFPHEPKLLLILLFATITVATIIILFNHFKKRDFFIFLLLIIGGILLTLLGKGFIYQILFDYIPLFETLRSAYRFIVFAHLFLIITISFLYIKYSENKLKLYNLKILFFILFFLNFFYISKNYQVFNLTEIPESYKNTYQYISNQTYHRFIYFPAELQLHHHISIDYEFGNPNAEFYWWQNPFESWYPSRNVRHPTQNMTASELNKKVAILYRENRQEELIALLKYAGVDAIIFDKYYNWKREVPNFEMDNFLSRDELKNEKYFEKIGIYYLD